MHRLLSLNKFRRIGWFVVAGTTAFGVDAVLLFLLVTIGVQPLVARAISISVAMVVAWWMNRTFTFRVEAGPNWQEFGRYVALAWTMALLNYAIFAVLMTLRVIHQPVLATAIASLLVMTVSFAGMAKTVFKRK